MTALDKRTHDRKFVRTFFTTPTAEQGQEDSAKKLRSAIGLRGMQAPDVWVPDNEDATAPNMRDEGAENIAENDEAAQFDLEDRYLGHETESHHELSFVSRFQDIEAGYDPEAKARMEASEGFTEDENEPLTSEQDD